MKQSKLIEVISLLSPEELAWFKKFLLSKMFNNNDQLVILFNHVRKQLNARRPDFSKQKAYYVVFGSRNYDNAVMLHTISYLFKALERFLAFNELYSDPHAESLALCRAYRKRNAPKFLTSTLNRTKKQLQKSQKRDIDHHLSCFRLEMESYLTQGIVIRSDLTNLQEINDQLDITYFSQKLRQCCFMVSHQNVYHAKFEIGMNQNVIQEVEQKQLYNIPAIGLYYYSYKAQLDSESVSAFKQLQKQLVKYSGLFQPFEIGQCYLLAINIGIGLLNKGSDQLLNDTFELYTKGIESKVLIFNNRLSPFTYKNIIAIALRMKKFDWLSQFIIEYKELLDPRYQEVYYNWGLANIYYIQNKYEDALKLLLMNTSNDDLFSVIDTKVLLVRIFFELNEIDSLDAQISSLRTFLRRKNITGDKQLNYQNFIHTVNKLVRLNHYDKNKKQLLLEEIENLQPLPVRYWFLEQLS